MTKYDQLSQTLLHAFMNDTPIEGGVRYHQALKGIMLDGTQDSLKHIDRLLTSVRRDMTERSLGESELGRADFRNFVLLVAFYVGKVATSQVGGGHWLGQDVLINRYPNINPKSFFQMMAWVKDDHQPLFVLQNIAARLFGTPDKTFVSPVNGVAAMDSVYWAVLGFVESVQKATHSAVSVSALPQPQASIQAFVAQAPISQTSTAQVSVSQASTVQPSVKQTPVAQVAQSQIKTSSGSTQKSTQKSQKPPQNTLFDEIKSDLTTLAASNDTQQGDYIKAVTVLDQVAIHIKNQMMEKEISREEVVLDNKLKNAQNHALKLLSEVAKSGNTNAIIRLALCFFEGNGVAQNDEKGAAMVRTAADKGDTRAQKLLSKLYYQGIGVSQSIQMGEMWLDKAAAGGHPEAKKIKSYMNQVQLMKDDYRVQNEKDRKFMLWLGAAAVVLVVVIWTSAKFL